MPGRGIVWESWRGIDHSLKEVTLALKKKGIPRLRMRRTYAGCEFSEKPKADRVKKKMMKGRKNSTAVEKFETGTGPTHFRNSNYIHGAYNIIFQSPG